MAKTHNPISKSLALIIRAYQYCISPLFGQSCRFYPSCSAYTLDAIDAFGCFRGCYLSIRRLLRCHPWHQGGFDPIPEKCLYARKNV